MNMGILDKAGRYIIDLESVRAASQHDLVERRQIGELDVAVRCEGGLISTGKKRRDLGSAVGRYERRPVVETNGICGIDRTPIQTERILIVGECDRFRAVCTNAQIVGRVELAGSGPMNGAAVTPEADPTTTPAWPEAVNIASRLELVKLPKPVPLFEAKPVASDWNVSVGRPSALSLTPALSTIGDLSRMTVCVVGSLSLVITGTSLAPVMVTVTGVVTMPPWWSST